MIYCAFFFFSNAGCESSQKEKKKKGHMKDKEDHRYF